MVIKLAVAVNLVLSLDLLSFLPFSTLADVTLENEKVFLRALKFKREVAPLISVVLSGKLLLWFASLGYPTTAASISELLNPTGINLILSLISYG